jgi:hypothetical protein
MLRRGIPFGPLYDDKPGEERGLLFLAYQTSFAEQFQSLNRDWINSPTAPELGSEGFDLLIGQDPGGGARSAPVTDAQSGREATITSPSPFVVCTGGGFFFSPSVSFLRSI